MTLFLSRKSGDVLQLQQPRGSAVQGHVQLDEPAGEEALHGMLRQDDTGDRDG